MPSASISVARWSRTASIISPLSQSTKSGETAFSATSTRARSSLSAGASPAEVVFRAPVISDASASTERRAAASQTSFRRSCLNIGLPLTVSTVVSTLRMAKDSVRSTLSITALGTLKPDSTGSDR